MNVAPRFLDFGIEAEQGLLGAVLINNEALRLVERIVQAEDFSEPIHQHLWRTMLDAERANRRIDPKLLSATLGPDAKLPLGNMTVGQYIARLAAEATTVINAPDYAQTIRDLADQNRLASIGASLRRDTAVDPSELAITALDELDHILSARSESRTPSVTMKEAVVKAVDAAAMAYQTEGRPTGISWGLSALDHKTLGLQRGELVILAGRPGMGKTAMALCVARKAALAKNSTMFVSLEMIDKALAQRAIADHLFDSHPLAYWIIQSGKFKESDFSEITAAATEIGEIPIRIEQEAALTITQIAARARQHKRRHGLDLLIVDHLHLVRASDRYAGHRVEEIGETTRGLKAIAKELGIPVLALCQLSRGVEGRDDKRPTLADLRGSGDIEQDADTVIMLYREAYYLERRKPAENSGDEFAQWLAKIDKVQNLVEAIIEKQRNGPIGPVRLFCSIQHNAIRDLVAAAEPAGESFE